MSRSLYSKLVLILIVLIIALMFVTGTFLMREIRNFYLNAFYTQMSEVFENPQLVSDLREAASSSSPDESIVNTLKSFYGPLGINAGTRHFYILDGTSGIYLKGSDPEGGEALDVTYNIVQALNGTVGDRADYTAEYMDVAIPLSGETDQFIIYIKDTKDTVRDLNQQLFRIIITALFVGLCITALLSMLLAKTMVTPIQSLTKAANRVANGDFSQKPESISKDEIGVLTSTFNNMATQLETTLDDLKRSEAMRREFVANVSHELRTPITSIRGYAETLEDSEDIPSEMRQEFLRVIVNESDRMTKIVQDLLTLSRFDAGNITFSFDTFSFCKSVQDIYNAMQLEAQRRNQQFILQMQAQIPDIRGDRARVEQVLMNMVSNALKYTHDGGKIVISVGFDDLHVWCRVEDNGVGIPPEDVPHVFERFYRVDKARSRESGGTGLGLSIAHEIVLRHDGDIQLQSVLEQGTQIQIWLPLHGPKAKCND